MSRLKYEDINTGSGKEIVEALESGDPEQIANALYSAAKYEIEWAWTQSQCLRFIEHGDHLVRWAAVLSLGYVAVYQGKLDLAEVLPKLEAAKVDKQIAPIVDDSLEMIYLYMKPN